MPAQPSPAPLICQLHLAKTPQPVNMCSSSLQAANRLLGWSSRLSWGVCFLFWCGQLNLGPMPARQASSLNYYTQRPHPTAPPHFLMLNPFLLCFPLHPTVNLDPLCSPKPMCVSTEVRPTWAFSCLLSHLWPLHTSFLLQKSLTVLLPP